MSDTMRDFFTFAPMTAAGDWAWVAVSWLLTVVAFGGYWLWLRSLQRKLDRAGQ